MDKLPTFIAIILLGLCVMLLSIKIQMDHSSPSFLPVQAEQIQKTESLKLNEIHIPKNCHAISINNSQVLIQNASGSQFILSSNDGYWVSIPSRVIRDLPEMW